ncbi:hypothetical protein HXK74_01575 [Candidatus Gracilibacteria bacterium]|nr:hypothetical protein [Candidatus Gracilibacteria bacterium]
MSKFQIKTNKKSDFFLLFLPLLAGIVFLNNFTSANGFGASLKSIESKLSEIQTRAIQQQKNQYKTSSKITTNLFQKNLQQNETKIEHSITATLKIAQNTIKREQNCDLNQEEIASYIYLNDNEFKQYRDLQTLKNSNLKKGKKSDSINRTAIRANGCLKIAKCRTPRELNLTPISICNKIVMDAYTPAKNEAQQYQYLQLSNFGNNKYQNGEKQDSDYDILADINQVGKIFFNGSQGFKDAPTTIFYQSPDFTTSSSIDNTSSQIGSSQNNLNTSNQQNNSIPSQPNKENNSGKNPNLGDENSNVTTDNQKEPSTTEDEEINTQINSSTPTLAKNQSNETLFANQCLPPGVSKFTKTIKKTDLDAVVSSNSDLQKNSPNLQNYTTAQNALNKINSLLLPTSNQNNKGSNPDSLTPDEQKELQKDLEKCTNKCESKNAKGKYELDFDERQVCKLQCLCGERSSPALEEKADFPILQANALRIRFCTIPAKAINVNTNTKTIYSIAEVISEILNPISNLNLGGRLSTRQKKSEFLDSEFSPQNLSKTAAFTTNLGTKSPPPITSDADKKTENQAIFDSINGPAEKNSYLILNHPISNIQKPIKGENKKTKDHSDQSNNPDSILIRNNQSHLFIHLSEFLSLQQNFLSSFQTSLTNINSTLTTLENKKK